MIIQLLLTIGLLVFLIYGLVQKKRSSLISVLLYVMSVLGIYFVWKPDHATYLAEWFGVGRGADLIFYFWIIIGLIVGLNLHLKLKKTTELVTQLARHIALQSAMVPDGRQASGSQDPLTDYPASASGMAAMAGQMQTAADSKKHPTC